MTMSDPLGDMLTRIRNGQRARQAVVGSPASKVRANVLFGVLARTHANDRRAGGARGAGERRNFDTAGSGAWRGARPNWLKMRLL